MKGKTQFLLISALLIFGMYFAQTGCARADDSSPMLAGASPTVAQTAQSDAQTTPPAAPTATNPTSGTNTVPVTEVEVKGEREKKAGEISTAAVAENGFVESKQNETNTQSTVTKQAISILGGPAQTNLLKALDLMPSISVDYTDPYGFTIIGTSIRVRGQQAIGMSTTIEGIPVWGIQQPGPRLDMFDLENIQSITLLRGAAPSDKGLGGMDTAGVLEVGIVRPTDSFGIYAKQSAGSYDMLRSFARIDSGTLPTDTKFYISGSSTSSEKWKGSGDNPENRYHFDFGVEQRISSTVKAEAFVDYNTQKVFAYRGLTYAQTQNIGQYYKQDYNSSITGVPATDVNYYGYNYTKQTDINAMGIISVKPDEASLITLRPYYWSEDKQAWSSETSFPGIAGTDNNVYLWENKYDRYGAVLEYKTLFEGATIKAGDWYESYNFPIKTTYDQLLTGGVLANNASINSNLNGRGTINSPYVRVTRDFSDLHVDLGMRYLYFETPGATGYDSASATPYNPNYNYSSNSSREWLPYLGASLSLNPNTSIYADYGRNYAFPQSWPNLFTNYLTFTAAHPTSNLGLQYFTNQIKLGTSDNYDLGLRFNNKQFYVAPAFFYSEFQNKLFSVFDPVSGQSVAQSVGNTSVYGAELEMGVNPLDNLTVFTSLSDTRSSIGSNIETAANVFVQTKGNQAPDTPKILAKLGLTWRLGGLDVTPVVKYQSSRFGDVGNTQMVSSYQTVDLYFNYKLPTLFGTLKEVNAGMCFLNLFNKEYISQISSFDYSTSGSYQVGPPRAVVLSLGARF